MKLRLTLIIGVNLSFYVFFTYQLQISFIRSKMNEGLVYIVVQTIVGGNDMRKRFLLMLITTSCTLLLLTGCFQGEQSLQDMDPPPNAEEVDGKED